MDKLFDLMVMGFKLQLSSLLSPTSLLNITLQHVKHMKELIHNDSDNNTNDSDNNNNNRSTITLMNNFENKIKAMHNNFNTSTTKNSNRNSDSDSDSDGNAIMRLSDWYSLRRCLLNVFYMKRVKVSLFMNEALQDHNGTLILPKQNDRLVCNNNGKDSDSDSDSDTKNMNEVRVGLVKRWDRSGARLEDELVSNCLYPFYHYYKSYHNYYQCHYHYHYHYYYH